MSFAPTWLVLVSAALLAATGACTLEPSDLDDAETPALRDCPSCTFNSPAINDAPFPELHLGGLPNAAGVSLVGLRQPGNPLIYQLRIQNNEDLAAYSGPTMVATGAGLIGWQLVLSRNGVEEVGTIRVRSRETASWAQGNRKLTTHAISFSSTAIPGITFNVCPTFVDSPDEPVLTIIPGQTYDRAAKRVDLIDPNWVTFACADEAAFKAKRLGYAQALPFADTNLPATRDQQDATLKMVTADYCGGGVSFTVQGTPVSWENTAGTVPPTTVEDIEAVWNKDGAICFDTPRVPGNEDHVADACPLPSCATIDLEQVPHEWVSWAVLE